MLALRVLFLLAGAMIGAFYPFLSAILAERGFRPAEIGLTVALSSLAFMLAVPVWGHLADVVIGRVAALRAGVIASTAALFGLVVGAPPIIVVGLIIAYAAFESSIAQIGRASCRERVYSSV